MGGLLHPNWDNEVEPDDSEDMDGFIKDGEEEEEEEEENRGGRRKRSEREEGRGQSKYVGAMAWFFPLCEWFVPWNGSVHFLPTGYWYSLK